MVRIFKSTNWRELSSEQKGAFLVSVRQDADNPALQEIKYKNDALTLVFALDKNNNNKADTYFFMDFIASADITLNESVSDEPLSESNLPNSREFMAIIAKVLREKTNSAWTVGGLTMLRSQALNVEQVTAAMKVVNQHLPGNIQLPVEDYKNRLPQQLSNTGSAIPRHNH